MSRLRRIWRAVRWRAGLVLASAAIGLLIAELAARAFVPAEIEAFYSPFEHDDRQYAVDRRDPESLLTLSWYVPGRVGRTGTVPLRIDNLGLRDDEDYPIHKPPGCYRVLGLGDSMTFGKGVRERDTYLGVLERRLRERYPGRCIEVLNAGMPNTNFFVQWLHFKIAWHAFEPDLVLVGFFVYNDTQLQDEEEPYWTSWMAFFERNPWLRKSALVRWIYYRAFFQLGHRLLDAALPRWYDPTYPGWERFRGGVQFLRDMARARGFRVAFALIPIPEGYDNYPYKEYHKRVRDYVTGEIGIPTFDVIEGLGSIRARDHWVHPSTGHPDAFVHSQIAAYLLEAIPWRAWIPPGEGR